jgi:putative membrane protein
VSSASRPLDTATRLAADRTWLADERTLMAWIRTATSLISFGFTIYKFFEFEAGQGLRVHRLLSPRAFGMIMIATGLAALLLGAIDHRRSARLLHEEFGVGRRSTAIVVAAIVSVMGLLALVSAVVGG